MPRLALDRSGEESHGRCESEKLLVKQNTLLFEQLFAEHLLMMSFICNRPQKRILVEPCSTGSGSRGADWSGQAGIAPLLSDS
jgi:hypothetical protein